MTRTPPVPKPVPLNTMNHVRDTMIVEEFYGRQRWGSRKWGWDDDLNVMFRKG